MLTLARSGHTRASGARNNITGKIRVAGEGEEGARSYLLFQQSVYRVYHAGCISPPFEYLKPLCGFFIRAEREIKGEDRRLMHRQELRHHWNRYQDHCSRRKREFASAPIVQVILACFQVPSVLSILRIPIPCAYDMLKSHTVEMFLFCLFLSSPRRAWLLVGSCLRQLHTGTGFCKKWRETSGSESPTMEWHIAGCCKKALADLQEELGEADMGKLQLSINTFPESQRRVFALFWKKAVFLLRLEYQQNSVNVSSSCQLRVIFFYQSCWPRGDRVTSVPSLIGLPGVLKNYIIRNSQACSMERGNY